MSNKIEIYYKEMEDNSLPNHLEREGLTCSYPQNGLGFDLMTPEILVIGSNILITVINALFTFLKSKQGKKIVIKGKNNWQIEVPASSTKEEIEEYIKLANSNDAKQIIIIDK